MTHARHPAARVLRRLRGRAGAFVVDNAFRSLSALGQLHPDSRPARHGVEVIRDVPYHDTGRSEHLCDIYRPASGPGPWPVVFYTHGGGFRILSKDTHWVMGLGFARRGYMVVSINYRLAPRWRYPAAVEDACTAFTWLASHGARWGADLSRLVLAGESAGANLATTLAICLAYRRPEPWARAVWDTDLAPFACLPACGMLQVSDGERFMRKKPLPGFVADRITEVTAAYLGKRARDTGHHELDLADPLVFLERGTPPDRPLPAFFAPVGTKDPILDDTRRLAVALGRLGVPGRAAYYEGEIHAFHALAWRKNARRCWTDTHAFLDEQLAARGLPHVRERGRAA